MEHRNLWFDKMKIITKSYNILQLQTNTRFIVEAALLIQPSLIFSYNPYCIHSPRIHSPSNKRRNIILCIKLKVLWQKWEMLSLIIFGSNLSRGSSAMVTFFFKGEHSNSTIQLYSSFNIYWVQNQVGL